MPEASEALSGRVSPAQVRLEFGRRNRWSDANQGLLNGGFGTDGICLNGDLGNVLEFLISNYSD
jgi:hypothetical protein